MNALTRNTLLAIPLGFLFFTTVPRHGAPAWALLDAFTLAFCFTYGGHWVEVLLLKVPGIDTGVGRVMRVLGWFAGGLWCYELGRLALIAYGHSTQDLPPLVWGGVFFVGLQFVVHGLLQAAGKPSFYSGQLAGGSLS
jgi:hypothetical protein